MLQIVLQYQQDNMAQPVITPISKQTIIIGTVNWQSDAIQISGDIDNVYVRGLLERFHYNFNTTTKICHIHYRGTSEDILTDRTWTVYATASITGESDASPVEVEYEVVPEQPIIDIPTTGLDITRGEMFDLTIPIRNNPTSSHVEGDQIGLDQEEVETGVRIFGVVPEENANFTTSRPQFTVVAANENPAGAVRAPLQLGIELVLPDTAPTVAISSTTRTSITIIVTPAGNTDVIVAYEYELNDDNNWVSFTLPANSMFTIPIVDFGNYSVKVRALSADGEGPESTAATTTINPILPSAPTISATSESRVITVTVTPVGNTAIITGYQYQLDTGAWTGISLDSSNMFQLTVENFATYSLKVRALSEDGEGPESTALSITTTRVLPTAPTLTATNVRNFIRVTVTATGNTAIITGYEYRIGTDSFQSVTLDTNNMFDTPALANGSYTVEVRALSADGVSPTGSATVTVSSTIPAPPTILSAIGINNGIRITVRRPAQNFSSVTGYEYELDDSGTWITISGVGASSTTFSHDILMLTNGQSYDIRVRALSSIENVESLVFARIAGFTVPDAPRNGMIMATGTEGGYNFSWDEPLYNGGTPISHYTIGALFSDGLVESGFISFSRSVTNFFPAAFGENPIAIVVYAVNAQGQGPYLRLDLPDL